MNQYKLVYFDLPGLGEPIRLQLNYVGQKFDDVRITHEQFAEKKPSIIKILKYFLLMFFRFKIWTSTLFGS